MDNEFLPTICFCPLPVNTVNMVNTVPGGEAAGMVKRRLWRRNLFFVVTLRLRLRLAQDDKINRGLAI